MRIQVYVEKQVSSEQNEWAQRLRAVGHRVHFALDKPFRKTEVCDAYVSSKDEIIKAYADAGIPEYSDSMLEDDKDKRTPVSRKKRADKKPEKQKAVEPVAEKDAEESGPEEPKAE